MDKKYVIGIDLGGTTINSALGDLEGNIICTRSILTNKQKGVQHIKDNILNSIQYLIEKSAVSEDEILSIGIGAPGPLDIAKGEIIWTPNLPFKNFNIVNHIKDRFNVPVYIDNDANVAAVGEFVFGAGQDINNMIYITLSTGIGGGAILNGKVYRGSSGNALEIGHMIIDKKGPLCNCGNYGCIEAISSGTAIVKKVKHLLEKGVYSSLKKYDNITCKEVFEEYKNKDKLCEHIIDEAIEYLGICIANVINCFDPEIIVIGGGISKVGETLFNKLNKVIEKKTFDNMYRNTKVVPAKLGSHSGVIGALLLAMSQEIEDVEDV